MRIAIVSTPRSGNSWFRMMLARLYNLEQRSSHTPDEIDWSALPVNCALQIHWHRTPEFQKLLADHGFRIATIVRHPLDVLISVLHFAPYEPQTAQWLSGEGGDEREIYGASPVSDEFLRYATGARARALFSVSAEWWHRPGSLSVRYEELVLHTSVVIDYLATCLGPPVVEVADALESLTIPRLRQTSSNEHFWQGNPGHWRSLIPQHMAAQIEQAHAEIFRTLGYTCSSDQHVSEELAREAWNQL